MELLPKHAIDDDNAQRQNLEAGDIISSSDSSLTMQTGEGIIQYYARHVEKAARMSFSCFSNRKCSSGWQYDATVTYSERFTSERFLIFSINGVGIADLQDPHNSEHISLGDWVKEKCLYNALSRISFFKTFRQDKAFEAWIDWTRKLRFQKQRFFLTEIFLYAKLDLCLLLNQLSSVIANIDNVSLMRCIDFHKPGSKGLLMSLHAFIEQELNYERTDLLSSLESIAEGCQDLLDHYFSELKEQESIYRARTAQLQQFVEKESFSTYENDIREDKSLKVGKLLRQTVQNMNCCPKIVRLTNYKMAQKLKELTENGMDSFVQYLSQHQVFTLDIKSMNGTVILSPTEEEMKKGITGFVNSLIDTVQWTSEVKQHKIPKSCRDDVGTDRQTAYLGKLLSASRVLAISREQLENVISSAFQLCQSQAGTCLDGLTQLHQRCESWLLAEHSSTERSYANLKEEFIFLNSWKDQLEEMPDFLNCGCVVLKFNEIKQSAEIKLHQALNISRIAMKTRLREDCSFLVDNLSALVLEMEDRPLELKAFVALYRRIKIARQKEKNVDEEAFYIEDGLKTLLECGCTLTAPNQIAFEQLREVHSLYKQTLKEAASYVSERQAQMLSISKKRAKELRVLFQDCQRELQDSQSSKMKELQGQLEGAEDSCALLSEPLIESIKADC